MVILVFFVVSVLLHLAMLRNPAHPLWLQPDLSSDLDYINTDSTEERIDQLLRADGGHDPEHLSMIRRSLPGIKPIDKSTVTTQYGRVVDAVGTHNRQHLLSQFKTEGKIRPIRNSLTGKTRFVMRGPVIGNPNEPVSSITNSLSSSTTTSLLAPDQEETSSSTTSTTTTIAEQDNGKRLEAKKGLISVLESHQFKSTSEQKLGRAGESPRSRLQLLDRITQQQASIGQKLHPQVKFTNHFAADDSRIQEETVRITEDDPDGLLFRLDRRWSKATCDIGDDNADNSDNDKDNRQDTDRPYFPPRIHRTEPVIPQDDGPYLGVLVDAARNFFPIEWLYRLVDFLSVLGYHMIHFRLVDDQSFAIQLECHPELAVSANPQRPEEIYTAQQMRDWVDYAKEHDIEIMPEVNVPGHAGGWHRIAGMILPCASFICGMGYGVPMDVSNPHVLKVIGDVVAEVRDIFSSEFLHLGGDEVHMSQPCFDELQYQPNLQQFEYGLQYILESQDIPLDKVIRWETTDGGTGGGLEQMNVFLKKTRERQGKADLVRTGQMVHYWLQRPRDYHKEMPDRFFISTDLYFDSCGDRGAFDIFQFAQEHVSLDPIGVTAAAFELSPCAWDARNVWGKLLVVAMAASANDTVLTGQEREDEEAFLVAHDKICADIGMPEELCRLRGTPKIKTEDWKDGHTNLQLAWIATTCQRTTSASKVIGLKVLDSTNQDQATEEQNAQAYATEAKKKMKRNVHPLQEPSTGDGHFSFPFRYTGVMMDMAQDAGSPESLKDIVDTMSLLGFNLLHLRLLNNYHFPLSTLDFPNYRVEDSSGTYFKVEKFDILVQYAASKGIAIVPEIGFVSDAGGWANSGLLIDCPYLICERGVSLGLDVRKPRSLPVMTTYIRTMYETFSTAPCIHLGTTNRTAVVDCYRQAYPLSNKLLDSDMDRFESSLEELVSLMGVNDTPIARWDPPMTSTSKPTDKATDSPMQVGSLPQYLHTEPPPGVQRDGNYILSKGLDMNDMLDADPAGIFQQVQKAVGNRMANKNDGSSSAPMAVVLSTIGIGQGTWRSFNIKGRLVAAAMGLSSITSNDPFSSTTFQQHCESIGLSSSVCQGLLDPASDPDRPEWRSQRAEQEQKQTTGLCDRFTHSFVDRLPLPAVFDKEQHD